MCKRAMGAVAAGVAATMVASLSGQTVSIVADRDNTLWERPEDGTLSSGAGPGLFTGLSGYAFAPRRRAVVHFDLSAVPAGATITGVTLRMFCERSNSGAHQVTVNRLLQNWGEGASFGGGTGDQSQANDATWLHTYYPDQFWSTPGGSFVPAVSATTLVGGQGASYTWSGAGMVSDVNLWLGNPGQNFGWILRGTESGGRSARRWASREWSVASQRPTLVITYTIPGPGAGVVAGLGVCALGVRRRR